MNDDPLKTVRTMDRLRLGMAIGNSLMAFPGLYGMYFLVVLLKEESVVTRLVTGLCLAFCLLGFYFLFVYWAFPCRPGSMKKAVHWFASAGYNVILFGLYGFTLLSSSGFGLRSGGMPNFSTALFLSLGLVCFVGAGGTISMAQGMFQLRLIRLQKEEAEREAIAREVAADPQLSSAFDLNGGGSL